MSDDYEDEPMGRCIRCGAEMLPNEESDYCEDCLALIEAEDEEGA